MGDILINFFVMMIKLLEAGPIITLWRLATVPGWQDLAHAVAVLAHAEHLSDACTVTAAKSIRALTGLVNTSTAAVAAGGKTMTS